MRTKAALYPYSVSLYPLVKHFDMMQSNFSLSELIAPEGSRLYKRDAAYACNYPDIGIKVLQPMDSQAEWETLIVIGQAPEYKLDITDYVEIIKWALDKGKSIVFVDSDVRVVPPKVWELSEKHPGRLKILGTKLRVESMLADYYSDCHVPVIFIGSLVNDISIINCATCLAKRFTAAGIKPLVLTTDPAYGLIGFHDVGYYLFDNNLTEPEKLIQINHLVQDACREEPPGVILVAAPDAIIRYNNLAPNGFGIYSYMLAQALRPDYLICGIPFDLAVPDYIGVLSSDFDIRMGSQISAVILSNIIVDSAEVNQSREVTHTYLPSTLLNEQAATANSKSNVPLFDISKDTGDKLFSYLISIMR